MDRLEVITLLMPDGERQTDAGGFALPPTYTPREVFGKIKSVGYSEFYRANAEGVKVDLKADIRTQDYMGETLVEIDSRRYDVLRSYISKNGEFIELTLTDLSQRSVLKEDGEDII